MQRRWWRGRRSLGVVVIIVVLSGIGHASIPEDPGELWVARYNGPGNSQDASYSLVVSPDGSRVFVTGRSIGSEDAFDYATAAYSAAGAELWVARYDGPGGFSDQATDLAVSPDGSTVFVTGFSRTGTIGRTSDIATVAYSAATGDELWAVRYNGPADLEDGGQAVAVSPDGSTVFVTGIASDVHGYYDYATLAYSAATGAELWVARYDGPGDAFDLPVSLGVSPDGSTVFVTGWSENADEPWGWGFDYGTVAYSAATGDELWAARYDGPGGVQDIASALAVSPDGSMLYVTGYSAREAHTRTEDFATVAYSTATGDELWVARYNGPRDLADGAFSLAVSVDGSKVFATGYSFYLEGGGPYSDYATVAYSAATGDELWASHWDGSQTAGFRAATDSVAYAIAVSPDGTRLFVTGYSVGGSRDYTTVAYSVASGVELWATRYDGPGDSSDAAYALAVSPDGSTVYVTGSSIGEGSSRDYALVAYRSTGCANGGDEAGSVSGPIRTVEPLSEKAWPFLHGVNCDAVAANDL